LKFIKESMVGDLRLKCYRVGGLLIGIATNIDPRIIHLNH